MSTFSAFFAENRVEVPNVKYAVSKRFIDPATGQPIEWELRQLNQKENDALIKSCTKTVHRNGVSYQETDHLLYISKLMAACVVYPNLKNAELQESYHVVGEVELLKTMLSIGEYGDLGAQIKKLQNLDEDVNELITEAKN